MNVAGQTHPSREELKAHLAGKLNAVESDNIERHLNECESCCQILNTFSNNDTIATMLRQQEVDTSVASDSQSEIPETIVPETGQETRAPQGEQTQFADSSSAELDLPPELRDHRRYKIVELLGHGGMGDVYRAEHKVMNRQVALKVIKPQLVQSDAAVRRFQREVQAAARLEHPNIVTAFDAEQAGDLHYLVMSFVDGVDLDQVIRERGTLPVAEACDYIRQAAEGLQYAHRQGMVHRDIKPHNLMVEGGERGRQGERESGREDDSLISPSPALPLSPSQIKILDFGLANFANETAAEEVEEANPEHHAPAAEVLHQLTQMGTMMGTPDYIAPEQAEDAHTADIRSDIYSLGCTFYTLLSGQAPFGEGSVLDKVKAHTHEDAPPLSEFRDDVPEEIEAVLQKMMAKDPAERYQTPAEVAAALQVAGASSPSSGSKMLPPRKRRPLILTTVATLFLALLAAAATIFYIQTNNGVVRVEVTDPSLNVTIAGQTISMDDGEKPLTIRAGAQKLIVRQKGSDFELVTDSFQLRRGDRVALKVDLLPGEVVVSKDRQRIGAKRLPTEQLIAEEWRRLVGNWKGISGQKTGTAIDAENAKEVGIIVRNGELTFYDEGGQNTPVAAAIQPAVTPKQIDIADQSRGGIYKLDGDQWTVCLAGPGQARPKVFDTTPGSGGGSLLMVLRRQGAGEDSSEFYRSVEGGQPNLPMTTIAGHDAQVQIVVFSPDGGSVLSGGINGMLLLHDVKTGRQLREFRGHTASINSVKFLDDGRQILSASRDKTIRLWSVETGQEIDRFDGHWAADVSTDGSRMVSCVHIGKSGGAIRIWDLKTGEVLREFDGVTFQPFRVAFSPDGRHVLSGAHDGIMRLWDAETGKEVRKFRGHTNWVVSVVFSKDGLRAASSSADGTVRIWDVETGKELRRLGHNDRAPTVTFATDDRHILSASVDGTVRLWDTTTGEEVERFKGHEGDVRCAAVSADGRFAASCGADKTVRIWRMPESLPRQDLADIDRIQGKWKCVSLTDNGEEQSLDDRAQRFMTFTGDRFTGPGRKQPKPGKFSLDSTTSPKQIDLHFPSGPKSFIHIRGIYRLDGDRLIIFQATDWTASKRPTSFDPKPGDKRSLLVFERVRVPDRELLQGAWTATALEGGGQKAPKSAFIGKQMVFDGDRVSRFGKADQIREFRLNPTTSPKQIDIGGSVEGPFTKGIYELNGDTLRVCLPQKTDQPRAEDFDTEGTRNLSITLERVEKAAADRLQGKWVPVSGNMRTKAMSAEQLTNMSVTFDGNRITLTDPDSGQEIPRGTFTIDSDRDPKHITLRAPDGSETLPGIFQFDGDQLKLAWIDEDYARPTDFKPSDKPDHMTVVLKLVPGSVPKTARQDKPATAQVLDETQREVVKAVDEYLAVMDEGKFGPLWNMLSSWAKQRATRGQLSQTYQKLRDTFGKAERRTLSRVQLYDEFPDLPKGRYAGVQYKTDCARQKGLWESVLLNVDTDGEWRVNTYAMTLEAMPFPHAKPDPATSRKKQAALNAAQVWLKLVDAGKYGESWETSAKINRDGLTKQKMVDVYNELFQPLGSIKTRVLVSNEYKTQMPNAPVGDYAVLQYRSAFTKGRVIETIVLTKESDGQWRVSGYFHAEDKSVPPPAEPNQNGPKWRTGILTNPPTVPEGGLATGKNLIVDPSLEDTATGELPKGWFAWLDDGPDFKCEVVQGGVTGKHCLQISGKGTRGVVFATSIPMDRTKRYALKGRVKVEGDADTWAVIKLNYFNKSGWLGVDDRVGVTSKPSGWQFFEKTDRADAFPETTLMVPTCHIEGNGTAWFDDLELVAYDRDKLPADFDETHGKHNRRNWDQE